MPGGRWRSGFSPAGYSLTVYDIDARRGASGGAAWRARSQNCGGEAVGDITITLVPSSVEVRSAVFGAGGAFDALRPGMTLIDLSGTDPDCARELQERLQEKAGDLRRRHDSRQRRAGGGHPQRAVCHRHRRRQGQIEASRQSLEPSGADDRLPAGTVDAQGVQDRDHFVFDHQQHHHGGNLFVAHRPGRRSQTCFCNSCRPPARRRRQRAWKSS